MFHNVPQTSHYPLDIMYTYAGQITIVPGHLLYTIYETWFAEAGSELCNPCLIP